MTGEPFPRRSAGESYQANAIEGASQGQLIVMLFDGGIRFLHQATYALERGDLEKACEAMLRAKAIVAHLMGSVRSDAVPELARSLKQLYLFCYEGITAANLDKSAARLGPVIRVLTSLRSAWQQVALQDKASGPSVSSTGSGGADSLYLSVTT